MSKDLEVRQSAMRKRWIKSSGDHSAPSKQENKTRSPEPTDSPAPTNDTVKSEKVDIGSRLDMQLEYRVCTEKQLSQDRSFSESYLPLTMGIAEQSRELLSPRLDEFPTGWCFQDRVLVWLAPTFREDVREFYRDNGPDIAAIFKQHHLEHLDKDLAKRLCDVFPLHKQTS